MPLVYVVTSGAYSDYGIEAVFSTEAKAQAYCADRNKGKLDDSWGNLAEIELFDLDNEDHDDRGPWHVEMLAASGDNATASRSRSSGDDTFPPGVHCYNHGMRHPGSWRDCRIPNDQQGDPWPPQFRTTITASSKEQAIKAANEQRAAFLI